MLERFLKKPKGNLVQAEIIKLIFASFNSKIEHTFFFFKSELEPISNTQPVTREIYKILFIS